MENTQTGAFTVKDFLAWSRISRTKFYEEVARGNIHICKLGSRTLIRRTDAERWLADLPNGIPN